MAWHAQSLSFFILITSFIEEIFRVFLSSKLAGWIGYKVLIHWRALFCTGFLQGLFFPRFLLVRKNKKKDTHLFQKKKWRQFRIMSVYLGLFPQKREIFAYFCLYFQSFYIFNEQNPTYLEFNRFSVSYNWNSWVTHFLHGLLFCTIFDIF